MSSPRDWFEALRDELPAVSRVVYLNTGTAGPTPRCSAAALSAELAHELETGRANFADFDRVVATREGVRAEVARLLGASVDEIALCHHSSDGINIVLSSLDWSAGDVIVTTTLEHDAAAVPLGLLRRRRGVELRFAEAGRGEGVLDGLAATLDERVRLVILSHVAYTSGALLPLREMTALVRQHAPGALVLADGAQTCGVLPLEVSALGVDGYTVSGQKWLCGPEGTGALYLARRCIERLVPGQSSYFSARHHDFRGNVELHDGARRFETAMMHRPSMAAFLASLRWMQDTVGIERAWRRSVELAQAFRQRIAGVAGVELVTPASQQGALVSFDLPDFSPAQLHATALSLATRERIICRSIDHPPYALRGSFGFFNTLQEVDRLVEAVAQRLSEGPQAVPIAGQAERLPRAR